MTYTVWRDLGLKLETQDYANYYFTTEKYSAENPLENLVVLPGFDAFFGPRVLNLFIVSRPYGWIKEEWEWVESWPPEGFEDAVARHQLTYDKFTSYKTLIFIDFNFATKLTEREPESRINEMLSATKGRLAELCSRLAAFGFEMGPDINSEVGAEFFAPYLRPHYGLDFE